MVRAAFLLTVLLLRASAADAITAEELRGMADEKQRENTQRQGRANTGSLGTLLPESPKSSKYGTASKPQPAKKAVARPASAPASSPAAASSDAANIYIPPTRPNMGTSDRTITTDAVPASQSFGIRLGSWLSAELRRNTTSAESGTVELHLTSDYAGDRRTLPAETVVFAEKTLNATTKRMELLVTHGITPDGREFEMRGLAFDPQRIPGLSGIFVLDKKQVASNAGTKGAIAGVGAAIGQLTGGVAGAAANAATQSALNDTQQASEFNNGQQAVIYVSPQPLLIRVEKQF